MKKILVVDDDDGMLAFIVACLKTAGYEVLTASTGKQGYAKALAEIPDIIVLDIMLPDMHGFDVCQDVRRKPSLNGTKILISSAKDYPADKKAARKLGADGYIVKPFTIDQLLKTVESMFGSP